MQTPVEPPEEPAQLSLSQPNSVNPDPRRNHVAWRTLRLLLLAITVIALWCITYDRWGSSFSIPARYNYIDTNYHLAMIKIAQEGDWPLVGEVNSPSLGAPFAGSQNDFPINNRTYWLAGYVARIFGLFPAANIMMVSFHLLAAFSFYITARLWRVSRLYSWSFAIIYSTLPQFGISLNYFGSLAFGLLPLQLYVCWYITTSPRLTWDSWRFRLTLGVAAISSGLNIYWVYLFLQFYCLSLAYRLLKRRSGILMATLPSLLTVIGVVIFLSGNLLYNFQYGRNTGSVIRSYWDIDSFAMRPIGLFVPPDGNAFNLFKAIYHEYSFGIFTHSGGFLYIGVIAILGVIILALNSLYRQLKGRAVSLPSLAVIWVVAFSSVGGGNAILSLLFHFYEIRATERYAIAIGTIALLYFVFFLQRKTRHWGLIPRMILVSFIGLFSVGDHIGRTYTGTRVHFSKAKVALAIESERGLVQKIESTLSEASMLFMLPVMPYPEYGWGMFLLGDYELFDPFLHSTKLRYSFGSNKGRQGADWQLDVQELPAGDMARTLESYGFAGILLNRKGYEDRGEPLLSELAEAGWPMEFEQGIENEWVFIRLTPAEEPVLPTLTPYAVTQSK